MSGGDKKVTVGYWYRLLYHFGLVRGPVDAFLELRAGDRTAWSGALTESGRITINKPGLWGGESSEGGLSGDLDVMFGEADQGSNDYLAAQLGADQPTYRGKLTAVWRGGRWGALNPYPKKASMKVRRILKGWDNDEPWYPEKAEIGLISAQPLAVYFALDMSTSMANITENGQTRMRNMQVAVGEALRFIRDVAVPAAGRVDVALVGWGDAPSESVFQVRRSVNGVSIDQLVSWLNTQMPMYSTFFPAGLTLMAPFFSGAPAGASQLVIFITDGVPYEVGWEPEAIASSAAAMVSAQPGVVVHGINIGLTDTTYTQYIDNTPSDEVPVIAAGDPAALTAAIVGALRGALIGMNPAHILYDSITSSDMQGEPIGLVSEQSFRAAADKLYSEGFGLCTSYDSSVEDIEAFQQRICDVIGGCLSQSLVDGKYYLDLIRDDYVFSSLPIITADDIIDFSWEPSVLTEQPNQVTVEWFDPQTKATRTTAPLQALGAIQAAGGVIPDVRKYPEIPVESLALRVADRDLQALSAPTSRFRITVNRRGVDLRPGRPFRLQYPAEGIADMVCVLGDIDSGTLIDGRIRLVAVQDVYRLPATSYVQSEPGLAQPIVDTPIASPHQLVVEAPYIEIVSNISRSDLAVFPGDAGVLMTIATSTTSGLNYVICSAATGEHYEDRGAADWCPTATVVEAAGHLDREFTLSAGVSLPDVAVGTWGLWGSEIVRVDAIDPVAGAIELGRGCADTPPEKHAAGSRVFFCGGWGGTDGREYVDGETVRVKLLTRTSSDLQPLGNAPELSVTMAGRFGRPYAPGRLRINGLDYPDDEPFGTSVAVSWAHRDRLLQDDQLVDASAASIGPEPGVQYYVRVTALNFDRQYVGEVLDILVDGSSYTIPASAIAASPHAGSPFFRIAVRATRDGVDSWGEPGVVVTGFLQAPSGLTAVAEIY